VAILVVMDVQGGAAMSDEQDHMDDELTGSDNGARRATTAVLNSAQEVAARVRTTASRAAERLPSSVSDAQGAARDTQRALDQMPSETLLLGTGFWLGMTAGLWLKGANRVLVALALMPAAAMASTLVRRRPQA
jgi:hypothetical protein